MRAQKDTGCRMLGKRPSIRHPASSIFPMRLHFVWIGKTRDRNCAALVKDYLERINRFAACDVSELKESAGVADERRVVAVEGARMIAALERDDFVILLDEGGDRVSSPELAEKIGPLQLSGVKRLGLVIGGYAGVSDGIKRRADMKISLSSLTLPHDLARVVLTEQIYRAFTLLAGMPYHKF